MRTRDRVSDTAGTVKPYLQRALKDDEVRESVKSALATAREIYDELIGGRGVTYAATRIASDKDLQESLRSAIEDLRTAATRVQGKDSHPGRNTTLLLTGIALGVLFNPMTGPQTRKWLADRIFGESGEFDYDNQPPKTNSK